MNSDLIEGKDKTQRIVSIEDNGDGTAQLFIQNIDGSITEKTVISPYWILTDSPADSQSTRLMGSGHYLYKNEFTLKEDFEYAKRHFRKFGDKAWWVNNLKEQVMLQNGITYYKGLKHKEVSVLSFDIESTTLEHTKDARVLIISNTFRDHKGNIERKLFCYDEFKSDKEMFESWCAWVRSKNPAIVLGHNIYSFDFPYMYTCFGRANAELALGRKGQDITFNSYSSKFRKDGSQFVEYNKCFIYGREIVDTFQLVIKWDVARNLTSYSLKSIIAELGLEVKDRQHYDASLIRKNYLIPEEWEKIKRYALHDADDALALWDYMGAPTFYSASNISKSFQEVMTSASGSQLNSIMVRNYLQEGHSLPKTSEAIGYEGAISFGDPGIFKNVNKIDIVSLYPSIMMEYGVFDKQKDPKGYFKEIVKAFTEMRLENKRIAKETEDKYFDDLQSAQKIFINSAYGFLGSQGLLFNSSENAAFITRKGREILNKAIQWAKSKNFIVANGDTDSISYCKSDMSVITKEERETLLEEVNFLFPDKIKFEADGYYTSFIVLKAKNYILFDGEKIKIKGSSLKSSKLEPALKQFLDFTIKALVEGNSNEALVEIYEEYVKEALNITDIKRWCSKKSITEKVETSERTNETKIKDAIAGSEYRQADKVYLFFKEDMTLCLAENFTGDYSKTKMLEKVFKTSQVFSQILPTKELFKNYSLKRAQKDLERFK